MGFHCLSSAMLGSYRIWLHHHLSAHPPGPVNSPGHSGAAVKQEHQLSLSAATKAALHASEGCLHFFVC